MKTTAQTVIRRTAQSTALLSLVVICQALVLTGFPISEAHAQSSAVTVLPTRLVLEEGERSGKLRVTNRGDRPTVYRLKFQPMRMTEEGRLDPVEADHDDVPRANEMLRFSPRRIMLKPGEVQTVRILVRRPSDLEPGEYRSRVFFEAEPLVRPPNQGKTDGKLRIGISTVSAVSLPIIVRHGQTSAQASIDDLEYRPSSDSTDNDPSHITFRLKRTGNESLYGMIEATWQPADGGQPVVVGLVSGIAVYTEVAHVRRKLAVRAPQGDPLAGGVLRVRYYDTQDDKRLVAQEELQIP